MDDTQELELRQVEYGDNAINSTHKQVVAIPDKGGRAGDYKPDDGCHLSCDYCLYRKQRCSKDRPTCRRCTEKNHECVYSPRKGTKRQKPNTKITKTARKHRQQTTAHITTVTPTAIDGEKYADWLLSDAECIACIDNFYPDFGE